MFASYLGSGQRRPGIGSNLDGTVTLTEHGGKSGPSVSFTS